MNRLALIVTLSLTATAANAQQYLGSLSNNPYAGNSISNPYGQYGSKWGNTVNNPYGQYGSPYSGRSANNPYASSPPDVLAEPDGSLGIYGE